jgi:ABC-2 type transport system permease protein
MKKFFVLTLKETKGLFTPQMILPLVITVFIFMFIGQLVSSQSENLKNERIKVALIDADKSSYSKLVKESLLKNNYEVVTYHFSLREAIKKKQKEVGSLLIYIPAGFSENLISGSPGRIKIYVFLPSFSFIGVQKVSKVKGVILGINEYLSYQLLASKLQSKNLKPDFLKNPIRFDEFVRIGEKQATGSAEAVMAFVSNQSSFVPIILTVVIIFSAQAVATAIAAEKEDKTLETLLAAPVGRSSIALSKMLASGLLAVVAALFYLVGFRTYLNSLTGLEGQIKFSKEIARLATELGLKLSFTDYIWLGLLIFASIMVALAIAIILGSYAESVKAVQSIITPLMVMILIPYLLTLFIDISLLPKWVNLLIMAIPFTQTLQAVQNLFFSRYELVGYGLIYQFAVFFVLLIYISRLFQTDRILTSRVGLKRSKRI